ncbi:unnamed protein product, partial [Mesorhabditis belari]|uniref:Progestin and adipoQ receptor family member 3 n=1 Tax=Mesorhabditis belari TaxID=2138241 RepID=A0AAF3J993_9BILA
MGSCVHCRVALHCKRHGTYKLVHRDKITRYLWLNEHVLTHYRPCHLPTRLCIRSTLHLTNETINIWSHLLGFLYFTYCQLDANLRKLPLFGASRIDHYVISSSLLASQMCMLFSALYHTFGCQSTSRRRKFLNLDVFGISAGLLGMYLSGIYTAFYCFQDCLQSYLYFLLALLCIAAYLPSKREKLLKKGSRVGPLHLVYSALVLAGLLPTIHWISMHGGIWGQQVQTWLPNMIVVYALTGGAFFFYVTLIPESLSPGTFDVWGSSHQWWHLLILAAMVIWHRAGMNHLEYHYLHRESCPSLNPITPIVHHNISKPLS